MAQEIPEWLDISEGLKRIWTETYEDCKEELK